MKFRALAFGATVLALALNTAACSHRETPVEEGNRLKILHVGNGGDIADLDPHTAIGWAKGWRDRGRCDGSVV